MIQVCSLFNLSDKLINQNKFKMANIVFWDL